MFESFNKRFDGLAILRQRVIVQTSETRTANLVIESLPEKSFDLNFSYFGRVTFLLMKLKNELKNQVN